MSNEARQEFAVIGMHCGGCVKSVTRAISQLAGVRKVDVSLEKNSAIVEYDVTTLAPAAIVAAIEGAGFEGSVR
jgi:copper chaperone